METFLLGGLANCQTLIVVVIKRIQCVCVVSYYFQLCSWRDERHALLCDCHRTDHAGVLPADGQVSQDDLRLDEFLHGVIVDTAEFLIVIDLDV